MGSLTTRRSDGDVAKRVREKEKESCLLPKNVNKLISGNLQQVKLKVARAQSFFHLGGTSHSQRSL